MIPAYAFREGPRKPMHMRPAPPGGFPEFRPMQTKNPLSNEIERNIGDYKSDFTDFTNVYFSEAKDSIRYWLDGVSRGTKEKVKRDIRYALNRGEFPIGYRDRYFETSPITLSLKHRICILITAKLAGSGKTVLGGNIMEQLMNTIDCHVVLFDSKPEFGERIRPNQDPAMVQKLMQINRQIPTIYPRGWENMVSVAPMFVTKNIGDTFGGSTFRYDLDEMEFSDILTLFDVNQMNKGQNKQTNKLRMAVHGFKNEDEMQEALNMGTMDDREIITSREMVDMFHPRGELKDDSLKTNLYAMLQAKVIGPSTKFDIVDMLNAGLNVQYITKTAADLDMRSKLLAYLSVELKRITRARYNCVRREFAQGSKQLKKPIVLYYTEFDGVFPRDPLQPEIKKEIQKIYDQDRYQNISIIADTAGIRNVHMVAIKQSDYLLTFKIDGRDLKYMIDERNISYDQEQQILGLEADKTNPPFECAVLPANLDQISRLDTFFPLPPMSAIQREQEIRDKVQTGQLF